MISRIKMSDKRHFHAAAQWHVDEITARIIAESGIPSDRFHLGKIILQSLKDDPEHVAQIDGATGQSETNGSLLKRSTKCALSMRKLGLRVGDVVCLMAPNHLDLIVPYYAGLFEGLVIAPIDKDLRITELKESFLINIPKMVFCQSQKLSDVHEALNRVNLNARVISFDGENYVDTLSSLLDLSTNEEEIANYRAADIDPAETLAHLLPTSGTTGLPKSAAITHKNFTVMGPYLWARTTEIPYIRSSLVASPLQWLSAILNFINAPIMKFTRIQSSLPSDPINLYHLINTYKPEFMIMSPTMMTTLAQNPQGCDFTCFKLVILGGSAVHSELIEQVKELSTETEVINIYGLSELTSLAFGHGYSSPPESCGKPLSCLEYKLIDPKTGVEINEPYKNGELWIKGPGVFKGYYNNPEATKEVFSEDGWFKTGDLMYRDASWNFFFLERLKLLLKYMSHQISPVELERVIIQHPDVLDVAVTAIPHNEFGDLPVACIVRKPGCNVTAQEIKDLVTENLSESKQLRGGVIFFARLPTTASTKLHRRKIKEMVLQMERE